MALRWKLELGCADQDSRVWACQRETERKVVLTALKGRGDIPLHAFRYTCSSIKFEHPQACKMAV